MPDANVWSYPECSRMLKSAQNFASGRCKNSARPRTGELTHITRIFPGFFGIPTEDQYNLEVMIEWPGYNCTLAPYTQVKFLLLDRRTCEVLIGTCVMGLVRERQHGAREVGQG